MESMPFLHANKIFTITFKDDLPFFIVRSILDQLLDKNAFDTESERFGESYQLTCDTEEFKVWVVKMEVIILRESLS